MRLRPYTSPFIPSGVPNDHLFELESLRLLSVHKVKYRPDAK